MGPFDQWPASEAPRKPLGKLRPSADAVSHNITDLIVPTAAQEIAAGRRFSFGRNWRHFLRSLDDQRVVEAEKSLRTGLGLQNLTGMSFLDVGSGSGLFSLAARRLGADVVSFDYDGESVACTTELQRRFYPHDRRWHITQGSVLDADFVHRLGAFDIVYSWGVLHHTGDMWRGLAVASSVVRPGGRVLLMLYLDCGWSSTFWRQVKRLYCRYRPMRWVIVATFVPYFAAVGLIADLLRLENPLGRYTNYKRRRGMSRFHDWIDWLGGYPFQVTTPSELRRRMESLGFVLERQLVVPRSYVEALYMLPAAAREARP